MDASYAITGLILFFVVVFLRAMEKAEPQAEPSIKYLSAASIISFVLVLMLMLVVCLPYDSKGGLDYLYGAILIGIGSIPFLIVSSLHVASFEDPIWLCLAFVVSFVLYTFLIFIVIRITLYLKNKFWSEKGLAHQHKS